jgi:Dit-like tail protein
MSLSLFSIVRSFGGISSLGIPAITGYVTISESAVDVIEITQHPIQQGAPIADHAFKKPYSVSIRMLFTDNLTLSLKSVYINLLTLQSTFVPFNVTTPKRTYRNVLLASLSQTTDKKTENCLAINATFQQVIIVPVTTTVVPRSNQKNAGSTGGTQAAGKTSVIQQVAGFLGVGK